MDFTCYLTHDSSFEPKDCAKYFEENNLDVVITSDYSDDNLKITITEQRTGKSYLFESYKMDRTLYKQMLEKYPKYEAALKKHNSFAKISPKDSTETALAITLLSYLHKHHNAKVFGEYNKRPVGEKKLSELREKCIEELFSRKIFNFRDFAEKYHLGKLLFSIILLVVYFIYDAKVDYGTDVFFFIIVIGIIVLWVHS